MDAIVRIRDTERNCEQRLETTRRQLEEESARRILELKEAHATAMGVQLEENRKSLDEAKAYMAIWNQRRKEDLNAHKSRLQASATERLEDAIALVMERLVE